MARPKVAIDAADVEKLASFGMNQTEIAEFFGVNKGTISRRFSTEFIKGNSNLKRSLRRKQVEVALSGNVVMLIWLGKNMLGQVDRQEVEHSGEITTTVKKYFTISPDEWDTNSGDVQSPALADRAMEGQERDSIIDGERGRRQIETSRREDTRLLHEVPWIDVADDAEGA